LNEFQFQLEPTRVRTPSRRLVVDRFFSARFYYHVVFFFFFISRCARDGGTIADWHRVFWRASCQTTEEKCRFFFVKKKSQRRRRRRRNEEEELKHPRTRTTTHIYRWKKRARRGARVAQKARKDINDDDDQMWS
jgi:hypothetical protein